MNLIIYTSPTNKNKRNLNIAFQLSALPQFLVKLSNTILILSREINSKQQLFGQNRIR